MSLLERIQNDLKEALKQRDEVRLSVLRMLKSEMKYREIDAKHELSDPEIIRVIRGMIKKREESIASFLQGGRTDLAEKEQRELSILKEYIPEEMSEAEIAAVVDRVLSGFTECSPRIFGSVMKAVMAELKDKADGRKVQEIVKSKLGQ